MFHKDSKISRRTFVKGAVAASIIVTVPLSLQAKTTITQRQESVEIRGNEFHLSIVKTAVNITGVPAIATLVDGMISGPTLRWKEGEKVTIHVTNQLTEDTSIHWHGIILPTDMDGVPDISFMGIKPGETFTYHFKVIQSGTFWYHSHSGFQEQTGIYGAIVIDPIIPDPYKYDKEYVITLSDWSDENPVTVFRKLKISYFEIYT